jgi:hypothetical protein
LGRQIICSCCLTRLIDIFKAVGYARKEASRNDNTLRSGTLEEFDQQFFGFTDEDGERVILRTACVDAVEVFDLHFLSEEDLQRALNGSSAKTDTPAD